MFRLIVWGSSGLFGGSSARIVWSSSGLFAGDSGLFGVSAQMHLNIYSTFEVVVLANMFGFVQAVHAHTWTLLITDC